MSDFDPYHIWLGIPETERPISKYRLLAIADFENNREVISAATERQTIYLRTLQAGEHAVLVADLLNEVSQARVTLLNADQKATYDEELRKQQTPEPEPAAEPPPIPVVKIPEPPPNAFESIIEASRNYLHEMQDGEQDKSDEHYQEIGRGTVTEPPPIPVVQTPAPTPVVVRGTVTQDFPVSVVQTAKKPRRRKPKEIWKRPAVIGVSVVGVIGVLALLMFSGDADPVASNSPPVVTSRSTATLEPEPQPQPQPDPVPADLPVIELPSITNTIGMTLNKIPAGTFMMGSPEGEPDRHDDEYQHKVTITKPFYMQTTEVTQSQWKAVIGTEPWKGEAFVKEGPNYAATYVSWDDAVAFCKRLSKQEGKTYRLPTEAEWEYACRAGTETTWSFGNDEGDLGSYTWYYENAYFLGEKFAHQVRLKNPNAIGLYDMHGNVYEWCYDYYEEDYYQQSPTNDPQGPESGSSRVLRGGSWFYDSRRARSAYRDRVVAGNRVNDLGFRLVRELD